MPVPNTSPVPTVRFHVHSDGMGGSYDFGHSLDRDDALLAMTQHGLSAVNEGYTVSMHPSEGGFGVYRSGRLIETVYVTSTPVTGKHDDGRALDAHSPVSGHTAPLFPRHRATGSTGVSLAKPVNLTKRAVPNTDTAVRSGRATSVRHVNDWMHHLSAHNDAADMPRVLRRMGAIAEARSL